MKTRDSRNYWKPLLGSGHLVLHVRRKMDSHNNKILKRPESKRIYSKIHKKFSFFAKMGKRQNIFANMWLSRDFQLYCLSIFDKNLQKVILAMLNSSTNKMSAQHIQNNSIVNYQTGSFRRFQIPKKTILPDR